MLGGEALIAGIDLLCYQELIWMIFLQILMIPYISQVRRWKKKREKIQYEKGFREFLGALSAALQAGLSLENAFASAAREVRQSLHGYSAFIREIDRIVSGMELNIPLEVLFFEFARRAGSEEIYQFSAVLEIVRITGGNIAQIVRESMSHLKIKLDAREEIEVILSGKIYEKNLMLLMPFLILSYLRITNPAYTDCLYHNPAGWLVMTGMLLMVLVCFFWTERIMDIAL